MRVHLAIVGLFVSSISTAGPEVAQMLKSLQGTWKCKGTFDAVITAKAELDGAWIHESMTSPKLKLETYTTFDRQWRRLVIASDGTYVAATSDGMKDMTTQSWSSIMKTASVSSVFAASLAKRGLPRTILFPLRSGFAPIGSSWVSFGGPRPSPFCARLVRDIPAP